MLLIFKLNNIISDIEDAIIKIANIVQGGRTLKDSKIEYLYLPEYNHLFKIENE